jgi:hypothetical protein
MWRVGGAEEHSSRQVTRASQRAVEDATQVGGPDRPGAGRDGGHAEQLELTSWHFDGTTATLDTGELLFVDAVVHSYVVCHLLGLGHQTVSALGGDTLVLEFTDHDTNNPSTIATHGCNRIKKLNSGG